MEVSAPNGRFTVAAAEGLRFVTPAEAALAAVKVRVTASEGLLAVGALSYVGEQLVAQVDRVKTVARSVESVADRWVQRVERAYRFIAESEQVRRAMGDRGREWVARHAPAPAGARRIVAALQAAAAAPGLTRGALLRAAAAAARDVAARSPQRALDDLFGSAREQTIRGTFAAWLASAGPTPREAAPCGMPLLLSDRDRRPP